MYTLELYYNVLGWTKDGEWNAIALEFDLVASGKDFEEALEDLRELVDMQVSFAYERGHPETIWKRAPERYYERFSRTWANQLSDTPNPKYRISQAILPNPKCLQEGTDITSVSFPKGFLSELNALCDVHHGAHGGALIVEAIRQMTHAEINKYGSEFEARYRKALKVRTDNPVSIDLVEERDKMDSPRKCHQCGEEVARCSSYALARDILEGGSVREFCGKCVEKAELEFEGRLSVSVPDFIKHELEQLVGVYGSNLSEVVGFVLQSWLHENESQIVLRLAKHKKRETLDSERE